MLGWQVYESLKLPLEPILMRKQERKNLVIRICLITMICMLFTVATLKVFYLTGITTNFPL